MFDRVSFLDPGGVIDEYSKQELYRTGLYYPEIHSYSSQVFGDGPIADTLASYCANVVKARSLLTGGIKQPVADEIVSFCEITVCKRIVLVGWIDGAVVEIRCVSVSPLEISDLLDEYRPDQGGPIGVYFCGDGDNDLLEIYLDMEIGRISVFLYRKP